MTCDTLREVKLLSKFQVPRPNGLGVKVELLTLKELEEKGEVMNG